MKSFSYIKLLSMNELFNTTLTNMIYFLSSPEIKAQVSFSDHLSSVVCWFVRLSVYIFSSSSPVPLGQFQLNLAQSIPG